MARLLGLPIQQQHVTLHVRAQAEDQAPTKPSQAMRDDRGRVNMDDLTDTELDYGCDEHGLATLRARLTYAINSYNGDPGKLSVQQPCMLTCNMALRSRAAALRMPA